MGWSLVAEDHGSSKGTGRKCERRQCQRGEADRPDDLVEVRETYHANSERRIALPAARTTTRTIWLRVSM